MKTTGIISALVLAHVAFAQTTDSTSAAASNSASKASAEPTKSSTKSAGTSTNEPAATGSSIPISQSQTSNSGNPLIPSSASETCTTFLNQLNTDTSLSSCFTPLLNALSAYTSSGSGSASSVSKTLNTLCASNACSASTMRTKLTEFKDACSDELTGANPNDIIIKNYDVFYSLIPFKQAVCTKDTDTQDYCLLNIGSGSSSSSSNATSNLAARNPDTLSYAANHLSNAVSRKRAQTVLVPNTDTYRNTNLMYLFTSPDMNAGELCVPCTQQILSKYIAFESATPYALGIKNSPLLGGQSELWAAIQEKCPASFLTEVSNIAGVASADDINAASPAMAGSLFTALAGALAAALALV